MSVIPQYNLIVVSEDENGVTYTGTGPDEGAVKQYQADAMTLFYKLTDKVWANDKTNNQST